MRSPRPQTTLSSLGLACLTLAACARSGGAQVRASRPHAVVEVSVTHPGRVDPEKVSDVAVLDGVRFVLHDQQGPRSLRLAPGEHELVLSSSQVEYRHERVQREVPHYCNLPSGCSWISLPPVYEDVMELVPEEVPSCSRTLHLKVSAGQTLRETLSVDSEGKCQGERAPAPADV